MPGGEEQKLMQAIAQELQSGKSPKMVAEELVQAGLSSEESIQAVRQVEGSMRGPPRARGGGGRRPHKKANMTVTLLLIIVILVLWYLVQL